MTHLTQQACWQIRLPKNLVTKPPVFHFGDFVPLRTWLQPNHDGVIWFGRIRSIVIDGAAHHCCYRYSVEIPRHHPDAWSTDYEDTCSEEELLDLMRRLGV